MPVSTPSGQLVAGSDERDRCGNAGNTQLDPPETFLELGVHSCLEAESLEQRLGAVLVCHRDGHGDHGGERCRAHAVVDERHTPYSSVVVVTGPGYGEVSERHPRCGLPPSLIGRRYRWLTAAATTAATIGSHSNPGWHVTVMKSSTPKIRGDASRCEHSLSELVTGCRLSAGHVEHRRQRGVQRELHCVRVRRWRGRSVGHAAIVRIVAIGAQLQARWPVSS